ncbi:MAG TPA: hypothetical protein PLW65_33910 [Pseudomonadota bacterium]|nr:hypothetical protein [Pseudomonadota bacterium]
MLDRFSKKYATSAVAAPEPRGSRKHRQLHAILLGRGTAAAALMLRGGAHCARCARRATSGASGQAEKSTRLRAGFLVGRFGIETL